MTPGTPEAPEARQARPFIDGLHFGECPRWHDGRLWYSDFYARQVYSVAVEGGGAAEPDGVLRPVDLRVEAEVADEPAGIGWLPDGRLLVVARRTRTVLRREPDGSLVEHGALGDWAGFHGNDMVVDTAGRAYVGNFGFDLDRLIEEDAAALMAPPGPPRTTLVRVDPDGTAHAAAADLAFPNGTVITPDGRTLIVAETMDGHLTAFAVAEGGELRDRRVWAEVPRRAPDGICLDAGGQVWVASAVRPDCVLMAEGGRMVDRVETSQNCFACMLGGPDRRTLFLVTAPTSTEKVVSGPRLGRIEQVRVDTPGAGLP